MLPSLAAASTTSVSWARGGWGVQEAPDESAAYDAVVVPAVDNASDRMSAYTHVVDDIGTGPLGGQPDAYLDLVELEALPFFRARYGIAASGDSLAMGGSSLGGLVTLYATMSRPGWFGCAIAMSSTTFQIATIAGPVRLG